MRGTAIRISCVLRISRITPAHAGNSAYSFLNHRFGEDHPRPCGEQLTGTFHFSCLLGSPPPMRGTVDTDLVLARVARITPAHAGNSGYPHLQWHGIQDHPRPCGEQVGIQSDERDELGSPPPMRGTGLFGRAESNRGRITPAHAGNS